MNAYITSGPSKSAWFNNWPLQHVLLEKPILFFANFRFIFVTEEFFIPSPGDGGYNSNNQEGRYSYVLNALDIKYCTVYILLKIYNWPLFAFNGN
jgi:hypothetical protein